MGEADEARFDERPVARRGTKATAKKYFERPLNTSVRRRDYLLVGKSPRLGSGARELR